MTTNLTDTDRADLARFLRLEAETPIGKIVHVVLDNYATHKHPKVKAWLARHPRFVFHFTPEIVLLAQCRRDFVLQADAAAAQTWRVPLDCRSSGRHQPLPRRNQCRFVWTAHPDRLIAAVQRGMQALESVH
jgi:hypothetical protein